MSVCLGIALCWPCLKISCSVPSGNIFCANRVKAHKTQFHKHFKTLKTQISQAFANVKGNAMCQREYACTISWLASDGVFSKVSMKVIKELPYF